MVDERLYFIRGAYIRDTMEELAKNGNAYFSAGEIFAACKPRAAFHQFHADLLYLMQTGQVAREGSRLTRSGTKTLPRRSWLKFWRITMQLRLNIHFR